MSQNNGSLMVKTYVSRAQLPVKNAFIIVSKPTQDGKEELLALAKTDESGLAGPFTLSAPMSSASMTPNSTSAPSTNYTLVVEHPDYQLAVFEELQIFPNVMTTQSVPMIPITKENQERPDITVVTPQPL